MVINIPSSKNVSNSATLIGCVHNQIQIDLDLDRSRSIQICQTRSIQSGEKERTDLSGHSGCGHLVLVCAERRRPRPLLQVNKLHRCPAAQMGVAKSDFSRCVGADLDFYMNATNMPADMIAATNY